MKTSSHTSRDRRRCAHVERSFPEFVTTYGRTYVPGSDEYSRRERLFTQHTEAITRQNCANDGWESAVNHLADWSDAELRSLRGHVARPRGSQTLMHTPASAASAVSLSLSRREPPTDVNWGNLSAIRESRDQGSCGSCWAYATETILRAHAEITDLPHRFSVAQLLACTPNPNECGGKGGCEGATAELALDYALQAGLMTDQDFPTPPGGFQQPCPSAAHLAEGAKMTEAVHTPEGAELHQPGAEARDHMLGMKSGLMGWTKFPENKHDMIVSALIEKGPVAIAVAAGFGWNFYSQGVMTKAGCDRDNVINHAVVLYGYGQAVSPTRGLVKFWRIKNSWSGSWGENGNLRLQRAESEEELCGWDNKPEQGSGCKGGPPKVWVCGTCGILFDVTMPHFEPSVA